jgi:hypothetical protein
MKKYYYSGATRVAMRTGSSTLNYLLSDHLGSTAITTNSGGTRTGMFVNRKVTHLITEKCTTLAF